MSNKKHLSRFCSMKPTLSGWCPAIFFSYKNRRHYRPLKEVAMAITSVGDEARASARSLSSPHEMLLFGFCVAAFHAGRRAVHSAWPLKEPFQMCACSHALPQ